VEPPRTAREVDVLPLKTEILALVKAGPRGGRTSSSSIGGLRELDSCAPNFVPTDAIDSGENRHRHSPSGVVACAYQTDRQCFRQDTRRVNSNEIQPRARSALHAASQHDI